MAPRTDAVDSPEAERKLTEPLGNVVWAMLCFVVAGLAIGLIATAGNQHVTVWGFGHGGACADVAQNGLIIRGTGSSVVNIRPGTSSFADSLQLCANHPTLKQRLLVTLTEAPTVLLYVAVLVQLWLLVLTARRQGPFALGVSRRLRFLGWFILAGTLAAGVGQSAARASFAATVVTGSTRAWAGGLDGVLSNALNGVLGNLIPLLLIVCGLLTLARIVRRGTQMHDDLAGTV